MGFAAALWVVKDVQHFWVGLLALPATALVLADAGEAERAVELYALGARYPFVANSRWFEDVVRKYIAAIAATLPPEVVATAQERVGRETCGPRRPSYWRSLREHNRMSHLARNLLVQNQGAFSGVEWPPRAASYSRNSL
jgi:hypothetical protein